MLDYTDFMNMTPAELVAYAIEQAGHNELVLALAHQLGAEADQRDRADRLAQELSEAEARLAEWQDEARALHHQLEERRAYG